LECRGLIKALKKLRFWLFGQFFTVTTDSQTLVWLLNQPPNDLPNAMMTRWLAYARLFDFDVRHVKGTKNGAADGLSRRGKAEDDESDSDPDEYFESYLYSTSYRHDSRHLSENHAPMTIFTPEQRDSCHLSGNHAPKAGFTPARITTSRFSSHDNATPDDDATNPRTNAIIYHHPNNPIDRYQVYRIAFNAELYEDDPDDAVLGQYLSTLQRPDGLTDSQYQQLRKKSKNFLVRDGLLFKRPRHRSIPPRRVVGLKDERKKIMAELHDEKGHMGSKATYNLISKRYQWRGMYGDVMEWIKTCDECQKRAQRRFQEPLHPTWSITVWEKVGMDIVYMPWDGKDGYIVFARDGLSEWAEARALENTGSDGVAKFLQEEVICLHGVPRSIVMDGGSENMGFTKQTVKKYGMQGIGIAPYHPQSNDLVERRHQTIINAIAKYKAMDSAIRSELYPRETGWTQYLALALWADRITTRRTTGYSAFKLIYGRYCLLPVQLAVES
jgi:hypothetical protein